MNNLTPERREQLERAKEKLQEFLKKDLTLIKLKEIAELQKETNQLLSDTKSDTALIKEIKELKEKLGEAIKQKPPIVNIPDEVIIANPKDIEFDEIKVNNIKDIQFPKQKEVKFPDVQDVKVINTNKSIVVENIKEAKQKEVEVINFPEQKEVKFPDNQRVTITNPEDIKQRKVKAEITNFPKYPEIKISKQEPFPSFPKIQNVKVTNKVLKTEVTNFPKPIKTKQQEESTKGELSWDEADNIEQIIEYFRKYRKITTFRYDDKENITGWTTERQTI